MTERWETESSSDEWSLVDDDQAQIHSLDEMTDTDVEEELNMVENVKEPEEEEESDSDSDLEKAEEEDELEVKPQDEEEQEQQLFEFRPLNPIWIVGIVLVVAVSSLAEVWKENVKTARNVPSQQNWESGLTTPPAVLKAISYLEAQKAYNVRMREAWARYRTKYEEETATPEKNELSSQKLVQQIIQMEKKTGKSLADHYHRYEAEKESAKVALKRWASVQEEPFSVLLLTGQSMETKAWKSITLPPPSIGNGTAANEAGSWVALMTPSVMSSGPVPPPKSVPSWTPDSERALAPTWQPTFVPILSPPPRKMVKKTISVSMRKTQASRLIRRVKKSAKSETTEVRAEKIQEERSVPGTSYNIAGPFELLMFYLLGTLVLYIVLARRFVVFNNTHSGPV